MKYLILFVVLASCSKERCYKCTLSEYRNDTLHSVVDVDYCNDVSRANAERDNSYYRVADKNYPYTISIVANCHK